LRCTFDTIDALRTIGWDLSPLHLFEGRLRIHGTRGNEALTLWYQATPQQWRHTSRYVATLREHGFSRPSDLRPDLVIQVRDGSAARWIVVEVKMGTSRDAADSARAALHDLLAYRATFRAALDGNPAPYGLGIAWGADLAPTETSEIVLCTPDLLPEALGAVLS
jgi:hypothetical protein